MNSYHFAVNRPIIFVSLWTETSIVPAILRKEKVDKDVCRAQDQCLLLVPRTKELTWVTSHKKHVFPCFLETNKKTPKQQPSTPKRERLQGYITLFPETYEKFGNQENNSFFRALFLVLVCLANVRFHFLVQFSLYFLFQSPPTNRNVKLYKDDIHLNENLTRQLNIN